MYIFYLFYIKDWKNTQQDPNLDQIQDTLSKYIKSELVDKVIQIGVGVFDREIKLLIYSNRV